MPGTVVHFDATLDDQVISEDFVLPDRGPGVVADVDSIPPPGSSVEICAVATTFDDHEGRGCSVHIGRGLDGLLHRHPDLDCTSSGSGAERSTVVHDHGGPRWCGDHGGRPHRDGIVRWSRRRNSDHPAHHHRTRTQTGFEYPDYFEVTDAFTLTASGDQATGTLTGAGDGQSNLGNNLVAVEVNFEATRS